MKTLDVHGDLRSEASLKISAFIKEGFNSREYFILIIHGQGKYVLKEETVKICENSKYVARFEAAPPQLGGSGATLVYLQKRGIRGQIIDI